MFDRIRPAERILAAWIDGILQGCLIYRTRQLRLLRLTSDSGRSENPCISIETTHSTVQDFPEVAQRDRRRFQLIACNLVVLKSVDSLNHCLFAKL